MFQRQTAVNNRFSPYHQDKPGLILDMIYISIPRIKDNQSWFILDNLGLG